MVTNAKDVGIFGCLENTKGLEYVQNVRVRIGIRLERMSKRNMKLAIGRRGGLCDEGKGARF